MATPADDGVVTVLPTAEELGAFRVELSNRLAGDAGHQLSINERLDLLDAYGYIYWPPNGVAPRFKQYLHEMPGVPVQNLWTDVDRLSAHSKERTGYPTQKPVALYERIVKASSNPGDVVFDPFCGCATTPIAAERLGRQWIGMDIWDGAYNVVKERLESIGLTSDAASDTRLVTLGDIIYTTTPPIRTDETADGPDVPNLDLRPIRVKAKWELLNKPQMREILADAQANGDNVICAGCGIALPVRYMELDHNLPRKDGGENVITNRILLCGPCNGNKSANLTLSGLRNFNRREGYMANRDMAELASSQSERRCRPMPHGDSLTMPRKKKQRGRPPVKPMPERIDATPEQLAQAMLRLPVDHEWQYLKEEDAAEEEGRSE